MPQPSLSELENRSQDLKTTTITKYIEAMEGFSAELI